MDSVPHARPGPPPARWLTTLLPAVLLVAFWALMVAGIREKSLTYDEGIHLTGGVAYWTLDDYRINPENGNLPQRVMALPALLSGCRFPATDQPAWYRSNGWVLSDQFLYDLGNDFDAMLLRGRAVMALLAVALGLVVYRWSSRMFGPKGGIVSLLLFVLDPTVLANGPLMTSDMAGALFFLMSLACLWAVLHEVSPRTILTGGLVIGGLFVSKMSGPLILVVGALLALIRLTHPHALKVALGRRAWQVRGRLLQMAVFAAAALAQALLAGLVIWSCYGFRYDMMRDARAGRDQPFRPAVMEQAREMPAPLRFARERRLLPEAYLYGQTYVIRSAQARLGFLNGEVRWEGWRSFFPYSFLVKTPLPSLAVILLALLGAWAMGRARRRPAKPSARRSAPAGGTLYRTAPLWCFIGVYALTAVSGHLNIGHRHLLPVYPPLFVLAGASAHWLDRRRAAMAAVLVVALALLGFETLDRFPNYLAYFNQVVGGPRNGYRHLVDSSLDWGQDLPALKQYLVAQGLDADRARVHLSYFGRGRPERYGIHVDRLDTQQPADTSGVPRPRGYDGGVYFISATNLQPVVLTPAGPWNRQYEALYQQALAMEHDLAAAAGDPAARARLLAMMPEEDWLRSRAFLEKLRSARFRAYLRQREPDDEVNYSILVYRVSDEQARQALAGPMPEDGPSLLQKAMDEN